MAFWEKINCFELDRYIFLYLEEVLFNSPNIEYVNKLFDIMSVDILTLVFFEIVCFDMLIHVLLDYFSWLCSFKEFNKSLSLYGFIKKHIPGLELSYFRKLLFTEFIRHSQYFITTLERRHKSYSMSHQYLRVY